MAKMQCRLGSVKYRAGDEESESKDDHFQHDYEQQYSSTKKSDLLTGIVGLEPEIDLVITLLNSLDDLQHVNIFMQRYSGRNEEI